MVPPPIWASLVALMVKNLPAMQETGVRSLSWKDPLEEDTATHSSILAWGAWWVTVHEVAKSQTGDTVSIPGSGRSPGGGNGNPLQYSCLGNPTDRGAWWATVHGVAESWTRLSD